MPREQLSYILGNPPFSGKKEQDAAQKADMARVFAGVKGAGVLDFVSAWYLKAADLMQGNPTIRAAFVSTNSITQGEQVGVLWSELYRRGMHIQFAHRTFKWSNEARGKAAVHCVIVGFGLGDQTNKRLFDYDRPDGKPHELPAANINPYLVDAVEIFLTKRMTPINGAPTMVFGSKAVDFGHFMLDAEAHKNLVETWPTAAQWIRPCLIGDDFLNGQQTWCLWLKGITPDELRKLPPVLERVEAVRRERLASKKAPTRDLANYPTLFGENRQPESPYLVMPKVSSERRAYIPLGFLDSAYITTPTVLVVPDATRYDFGIIQSVMHMAWMRYTCGRMKSDYQYSN
ncbi:type II restriction enzyme (methylase subunit), partial [mine drainage metagenome]